jgi:phosphonate transport system substrate-binding protein
LKVVNVKSKTFTGFLILFLSAGVLAQAQQCERGDLIAPFCDENRDLVADAPQQTISPGIIQLGISSTEDYRTAEKTYFPLVTHLQTCLKKEVRLHPQVRQANVLESMRTGSIHLAQFATGGTMFAVNFTGAIPFTAKGFDQARKPDSYTLMLIVRSDSAYRKPSDLVGKVVAHTSTSSNSGNLAPRALFPALGLEPDKDYRVVYSGQHDNSIFGVNLNLYDAAAVASDVFDRLVAKGEIKRNQFRILYESEGFPPDAFAHSNRLDPNLVKEIKKCFTEFKFPDFMSKQLEGNNRFYPIDYNRDWRLVRLIAKASGQRIDKEAYDKLISEKK